MESGAVYWTRDLSDESDPRAEKTHGARTRKAQKVCRF